MDGKALDRIKAALADCPHPRGLNGTPTTIELSDDPENPDRRPGRRNPCIGLLADDIVATCELIPDAQRDAIVRALRRGSLVNTVQRRLALGPVDEETGDPLDETSLSPLEVYIHVDHAWHLVEAVEALGKAGS